MWRETSRAGPRPAALLISGLAAMVYVATNEL